jgi:hypothetical protein
MEYKRPAIIRSDNGSDTASTIKTIPMISHLRQLGNTFSQSVFVLSAMESLTGTTNKIRVPTTVRIKEISLIKNMNV